MARIDFSITRGIALVVIALHAIVLPVLYYGLSLVVSHSHSDLFIQHVRTLSRNIADELELGILWSRRSDLPMYWTWRFSMATASTRS